MSLYCLVHGTTQSAAGWKLLVAELESHGHTTLCIDLPNDQPEAGANYYADAVARELEGKERAVVVAHSASGLFLPLIAIRVAVLRIVFLAAVIPEIGRSFLDQYREAPEMYCPDFVGVDPTEKEELARHFLFHDCEPAVASWAFSTVRLSNMKGTLLEVSPLARWPDVPSSYISCTGDRTIRASWWEQAARARLGVEPIRIQAGHAPHVCQPAELAATLYRLSLDAFRASPSV